MAKYKCIMCGYIFDEILEGKMFMFLDKCPSCGEETNKLKLIKYENMPKRIKYYNAIDISDDNPSVEKIYDKCIDCGLCNEICKNHTCIKDIDHGKNCINCGKCIQVCPVKALVPKSEIGKVKDSLNKKTCICYIAPSVRVTLAEVFNLKNVEGKLVTALKKMGFNFVLDACFGADMTVIEEANELAQRIKYNNNLPLLSSCCPSWVKYINKFYPSILNNLSTVKSPLQIQETLIRTYYSDIMFSNNNELFTVAIVPCTSKKNENYNSIDYQADAVITVQELMELLYYYNVDLKSMNESIFDRLLSQSSNEGTMFGVTGGVCEAVLKTVYKILTGKECDYENDVFVELHKNNKYKDITILMDNFKLKALVINGINNVQPVLDEIINNKCEYHFIEVMTCSGGCVNGSGNVLLGAKNEQKVVGNRIDNLLETAKTRNIKYSHNNPEVINVYKKYLDNPGSIRAINLLHIDHNSGDKND